MTEIIAPGDRAHLNFVSAMYAAVKDEPNREALVCGEQRLSRLQQHRLSNRVANALLEGGFNTGDRIAIIAGNSIEYVCILAGVARAGLCLVPLSPMATGATLNNIARDSGAKLLFASESTLDLARDITTPMTRVAIDFAHEPGDWIPFHRFIDSASDTTPEPVINDDTIFAILYSSGTTGDPKGVIHDHYFRSAQNARMKAIGVDIEKSAVRTLVSTPFYSHATLTAALPTLAEGGTLVVMPSFDTRKALSLIESERITHAMMVPVQYKRIVEHPEFGTFDLGSVEFLYSSAAPLRPDVKKAVVERIPGQLIELYGATEGGATTVLRTDDHPDKLHTVGRPGPSIELRFIDEQGNEVATGLSGEVCGRAPSMMRGYWSNINATDNAIWRDKEGREFIRSGDIGQLDQDGFLVLSDRRKDMIISGGMNVYANDLELALLAMTEVDDAAVIGIPSEQWGETPLGFVVLRENTTLNATQILQTANQSLGKHQQLSAIEIVTALPRSNIGKVLKRVLREPYWT